MTREPWIESAVEATCDAFVRGHNAACVQAPMDADMDAFRRVVQDESGGRTLVALVGPRGGEAGMAARLADAIGLLDHGLDAAREVESDKILQALIAFLEGLLSLDARCLVVVDGPLAGDDEREFTELVTRAALRKLPLYVIHVTRADAVPIHTMFDRVVRPSTDRRLQLAAVVTVFAGLTSMALYSWHHSAAPSAIAVRNGQDVALRAARLSLGTTAHDGERTAIPLNQIGVVDGTQSSNDAVLRQAERLARLPDVRGLLELRTSIEESRNTAGGRQRAILAKIDALVKAARRRQLELDHERLRDGSRLQR